MPFIDIAVIVLLVGGAAWFVIHKVRRAKEGKQNACGCSSGCSPSQCPHCQSKN